MLFKFWYRVLGAHPQRRVLPLWGRVFAPDLDCLKAHFWYCLLTLGLWAINVPCQHYNFLIYPIGIYCPHLALVLSTGTPLEPL